jgi:hypothetical protein
MTGGELPETDHAARYVGAGRIDRDGRIAGNAFIGSVENPEPSCHWLEIFGQSESQQIDEVRRRSRLQLGANAVFAVLNVGKTRSLIEEEALLAISFIHMPLDADPEHPDDPSHCVMTGVPRQEAPEAEFIGDLISQTIVGSFPARPRKV